MRRSAFPLLLALGAPLMLTVCATIGPPQPPSLELPKPPQDLRASRKGNRVTLTWTIPTMTTDRQTIRNPGPARICRSTTGEMKECGTPDGELAPSSLPAKRSPREKIAASFIDTLPAEMESASASEFVTYAVEVLNRDRRAAGLSNQVRVPLLVTLPPPRDFQASVTSQGVVLSWRNEVSPRQQQEAIHFVTRVYRREEGARQQTLVGETAMAGQSSITDSNIEWEKTYEYHAVNVTVVDQPNKPGASIESDDTPELKVFAQDVFPPAVPAGLQAVFSGPGQAPFIDLVWAPVTDPDLAGYNVYRHEEGTAPVKLNSEPVKTPAYRDTQVSAGKRYLYSVTSIDARGNESAQSEEARESVP